MPPPATRRLPVVGVMGSGSTSESHLARPLGAWLASQKCHLLCGGGGGTMTEIARAFVEAAPDGGRQGLVIGVLPGISPDDTSWGARESSAPSADAAAASGCTPRPPPGYPNPYVEIPIYTHLPTSGKQGQEMLSRNHINILSSDVVVALPGGPGTASEAKLALQYGKPLLLFTGQGGQIATLDATVETRAAKAETFAEAARFITDQLSQIQQRG